MVRPRRNFSLFLRMSASDGFPIPSVSHFDSGFILKRQHPTDQEGVENADSSSASQNISISNPVFARVSNVRRNLHLNIKQVKDDTMVQLFYYENRGQACRKILNHEGSPFKIFLFADEGWARGTPTAHWLLKRHWWNLTGCKVTEITATRRISVKAKMVDLGRDTMCIKGRFKDSRMEEPDFKMYLTTRVSSSDFRQGYSMTGTLERGNKKHNEKLQLTHFAMLKRKDYTASDDNNNNE